MRPALARVPGAGRIEALASDTREIQVVLDPMKLTAAGLTVSDVAAALKAQNQLQPVGRFSQSGQQHLTLVSGLWSSVEDIAATGWNSRIASGTPPGTGGHGRPTAGGSTTFARLEPPCGGPSA